VEPGCEVPASSRGTEYGRHKRAAPAILAAGASEGAIVHIIEIGAAGPPVPEFLDLIEGNLPQR
jgi:hypothetical protein